MYYYIIIRKKISQPKFTKRNFNFIRKRKFFSTKILLNILNKEFYALYDIIIYSKYKNVLTI